MPLPTLTRTHHRDTYPAISPEQPSVSQSGKTVLVTGGGSGLGFEIVRSFAKASASRIIIIGRRSSVVDAAVAKLQTEFKLGGTEFIARQGDIADDSSIISLWETLASQKILVDVLVLNAAAATAVGPDTLSLDKEQIMRAFDTNVGGNFLMSAKFVQQHARPQGHKSYLVNVTTAEIQMNPWLNKNAYTTSRAAFTALLGRIADERSLDDVQIVTFHPGTLYSESAAKAFDKDAFEWDEFALPANFSVWAASPEASWLHGRYVWAHWDINELKADKEFMKRLEQKEGFLKVGVLGLPSFTLDDLLEGV